jgi:hypothetical protein
MFVHPKKPGTLEKSDQAELWPIYISKGKKVSTIPILKVQDFQTTDLQASKSNFSSKQIVFGLNS